MVCLQAWPSNVRAAHGATLSAPSQPRSCNRSQIISSTARGAPDDKVVGNLDVSGAVVNPSFRSTPWQAEKLKERTDRSSARIALVSESNVCRSAIAEGIIVRLLQDSELIDQVEFASRATRDYNIGESAEPSAAAAVEDLGFSIPEGFAARKFDFEKDTVYYDLILVMDKFTAADVMREISVYDTINKEGKYTQKVRRLGEFHPVLKERPEADGQDIDDPLYGNVGGKAELSTVKRGGGVDHCEEAVRQTASLILESCEGLLDFLMQLRMRDQNAPLCTQLRQAVLGMKELDWLVPPMLSSR